MLVEQVKESRIILSSEKFLVNLVKDLVKHIAGPFSSLSLRGGQEFAFLIVPKALILLLWGIIL